MVDLENTKDFVYGDHFSQMMAFSHVVFAEFCTHFSYLSAELIVMETHIPICITTKILACRNPHVFRKKSEVNRRPAMWFRIFYVCCRDLKIATANCKQWSASDEV